MEKYPKNTTVYFWYDGNHSSKKDGSYEIYGGTIHHWHHWPGKDPKAQLRTFNGFSIWLPEDRLFLSKKDCRVALRDKLLNEILD